MTPIFQSLLSSGRVGIALGALKSKRSVDYKSVYQHPRSFWFLLILGIFASIFIVIEINTLNQVIEKWQKADSLFMLVTALFTTFWLIGWSIGVIALVIIFLIAAFGRQVLIVHSGKVDFIIGIPGLGGRVSIRAAEVSDISLVDCKKNDLFSKEDQQLLITTDDGKETRFGANFNNTDLLKLQQAIDTNRNVISDLGNTRIHQEALGITPANSQQNQQTTSTTLSSTSVILLLLANLVPIYGVLFHGWEIGEIMVLYWAETGIIVLYSIAKLIITKPLLGFIFALFTLAHSGGFMALHFLFIWEFFVNGLTQSKELLGSNTSDVWPYLKNLWPALAALIISHGFSFKQHFFDKRSQKNIQTVNKENIIYSRFIIMHLTVIFGGFMVMLFDHAIYALLLLIAMKITVDINAHMKLHNKGKE